MAKEEATVASDVTDSKIKPNSATNSGFNIAEVFIPTLSAPAFNRFLISSHVFTPPPTVNGINICFATLIFH